MNNEYVVYIIEAFILCFFPHQNVGQANTKVQQIILLANYALKILSHQGTKNLAYVMMDFTNFHKILSSHVKVRNNNDIL